MNTTITSDDLPRRDAAPAVDDGLRSAGGIRWLHWIGALVVGVSAVGLLAARWGELPLAVQFLVLTAGAVALKTAGDVARHRLRLPATGAALHCLFTALVPLLAWGAAYLRLTAAPFGWLSLGLGLGALLWCVRSVLERVLDYRGAIYPAALGILLFALPLLPLLEEQAVPDGQSLFLVAAVALGLVLRFASRHVNRFFFHRDRTAGLDRPVHFLPFALLALTYVAGMSVLSAAGRLLAVPLAFLAVALVDTGEEYFRAWTRATGQTPGSGLAHPPRAGGLAHPPPGFWPRRSVGLLASGFALLALAAALSPLDPILRATALVTAVAALRLVAWALRYRHNAAYAFALASALTAYHFSPAVIPESVKVFFWNVVEVLAIRSDSTAVISLADLGALTGLVVLGGVLRRWGRLTTPMLRIHAALTAFQGLVVLLAVVPDPAAARILMPLAALLLGAGLAALRRAELMPVLYLAASGCAVLWGAPLLGAPVASIADWWSAEAAAVLALTNLVFAAAGLAWKRRRPRSTTAWAPWTVAPPVAGTAAVVFAALVSIDQPALAGFLLLAAAGTVVAGGFVVERLGLVVVSTLLAWAGAHLAAYAAGGESVVAVALSGHVWLLGFWQLERRAKQGTPLVEWARPAWVFATALGAVGGVVWWMGAAIDGSWAAAAPHLVLLGMVLIDLGERRTGKNTAAQAIGLRLVALWLPVQLFAADVVDLTLALLLAAVAERVAAEVLERRGRTSLAHTCYPTACVLAAAAGSLAIVTALDTHGSPWWPILPGFLASLFFAFMSREEAVAGHKAARVGAALAAAAFFALSLTVLFRHLSYLGPELYWLAPGLVLIALSRLLAQEIGARWSHRLFTAGAGCLYAMPVLGLLEELAWGWQIVLLLLAVAFGAASFRLRSRPLLTLSTAAALVDLAFFLLKLGQTAPLLLWAVGIFFGLSLMGCATLLEYRRELLLQKVRVWGREIRSWA